MASAATQKLTLEPAPEKTGTGAVRQAGAGARTGVKGTAGAAAADAFVLFAFTAGFASWLSDLFSLTADAAATFASLAAISTVTAVILALDSKKRMIGLASSVAAIAALMAGNYNYFSDGRNILLNNIIDAVGKKFPYMMLSASVSAEQGAMAACGTYAFVLIMAAVVIISAILMAGESKLLPLVLLAAIPVFQFSTGIYTGTVQNVMCAAGACLLYIRCLERGKNGRARSALGESAVPFAILCAVTALALGPVLASFAMPKAVSAIKSDIKAGAYEARYGKSVPLTGGMFTDLGSFLPAGSEALTVTMSMPGSYYLRGFIGGRYTGRGWIDVKPEDLWSARDVFYTLHQKGFYGQEMLASAAAALDPEGIPSNRGASEANGSIYGQTTVTVKNTGADSRYMYVPYELYDDGAAMTESLDAQRIGDSGIVTSGLRGQREYSYNIEGELVTKYPSFTAKLADEENLDERGKEYKKLEALYNKFAYEEYLEVPAGLEEPLTEILGARQNEDGKVHVDYVEAKQNILYALMSGCKYTERLDARWNGTDFVYDFLEIGKAGYSVHYASAACMMFRYYGIPARYVEGYLITPDDAASMKPGEEYALDDTHAHAWVEYYQDGVGWLPFEVTPSYIGIMHTAEDYQDITGIAGSDSDENDDIVSTEDDDEDQKPMADMNIDWFLIAKIALMIVIFILILTITVFVVWIAKKRAESRREKEKFTSPDVNEAVRSLFNYSMNILAVSGLKIRNISLYKYARQIEKMLDAETAEEYMHITDLRQEAVYSAHTLSEADREALIKFKNKIWKHAYENGSRSGRFRLKYIYFL